jgi:hypothetical protein
LFLPKWPRRKRGVAFRRCEPCFWVSVRVNARPLFLSTDAEQLDRREKVAPGKPPHRHTEEHHSADLETCPAPHHSFGYRAPSSNICYNGTLPMNVLVDDISGLWRIDQSVVSGQVRYYYVPSNPEALIVVVSRVGPLELLVGKVTDAAIGWSVGWHGKCHPEHDGLQILKVTLFGVTEDTGHDTTLSALVAESRRLPRKRPPRRARWARPYGFDQE